MLDLPWIDVCDADAIDEEDVIRFDHGARSYALHCTDEGEVFCTEGLCSHDGVHLAGGILTGTIVECPAAGCQFDVRTGAPKGGPAMVALATYPARIARGRILAEVPG